MKLHWVKPQITIEPVFTTQNKDRKIKCLRLPECIIEVEQVWKPIVTVIKAKSAEILICLEEQPHDFLYDGQPIRIKEIYIGTSIKRNYNYNGYDLFEFN